MKKFRLFAIIGVLSILLSSCDVLMSILDAAATTEQTDGNKKKDQGSNTDGGKTNDSQKKTENTGSSGGKTRDKK
ncbi:MAG TPA: hypothetical protein DCQ31_02260 [Bacteroidales bacterium]|nr:hypothetical protein [Bacteroidales bacterium]